MKIKGINPAFHKLALKALINKDATAFMILVGHRERGDLLANNAELLLSLGILEQALYETITHGPSWPPKRCLGWLCFCDRKKLAACGDLPIPSSPITVFRGVRKSVNRKFIRGVSWSTSPGVASWFATRGTTEADSPAVYQLSVPPDNIFFMTNEREEMEVVINPFGLKGLKRLHIMPEPQRPV